MPALRLSRAVLLSMALLALPAAVSAGPIRVTGQIVGPGNQGVRVELLPAYPGAGEKAEPAPVAAAKTDAEGFFELTVPESGGFRVRIQSKAYQGRDRLLLPLVEDTDLPPIFPDRFPETRGVEPGPAAKPEAPAVQAKEPRTVIGKVVETADGSPVPGALVWTTGRVRAAPVHAGPDGGFKISVPAGEEVAIQAAAAGHLISETRTLRPGQTQSVLLKLDRAAQVRGVVVDPEGRPVPRALILLRPAPKQAPGRSEEVLVAWSRAGGRFQISGLTSQGRFEVKVERTGFVPASVSFQTPAAGQQPPPLRIVLGQGQTLAGRVVDESGSPVAGAALTFLAREENGGSRYLQATSDSAGKFELRRLTPGRADVWVRRAGFAAAYLPVEIPSGQPRVDAGTIELKAGVAVDGRVVDEQGRPVEGAEVRATDESLGDFWSLAAGDEELEPAKTGPDGSFRIPDLRPGATVDLEIRHPAFVAASVPGVEAPTPEPLRIEMKAALGLAGRVVGPDGEPVANASLVQVEETRVMHGFSASSSPLGTTDAEGRFRVGGLKAGPVNLEIHAKGYQLRRLQGVPVPQESEIEIRLERGAVLKVTLLGPDGEPVAGVRIYAESLDRDHGTNMDMRLLMDPRARTGEDGVCFLELPQPGRYRVGASAKGRSARFSVQAGPGTTPVELRFPRGVEVSGRVVDGEGAGIPAVEIAMGSPETEQSFQTTSEADGSFTFQDVVEGVYMLNAEKRGYRSLPRPVEVRVAGTEVAGLDLRLEKKPEGRASITGHIMGLSPEELARTQVSAQSDVPFPVQGRVERDGSYRIRGLESGAWEVQAMSMSGRRAKGQVLVPSDAAEVTLDLEFQGIDLAGRVLVDGAPLSGGEVWLSRGGDFVTQARTAYDGSFRISVPSPGRFDTFVLARGGTVGALQTLEIRKDDREVTVEVRTESLGGHVVSTAGPVTDAVIAATGLLKSPPNEFSLPAVRSGPEGAFEMRVAPGRYRLQVTREGFAPAEAIVEVRAGAAARIEVPLDSPIQ